MKEHVIAGIDLGSSVIRLAVGQITIGTGKRPSLHIIGAVEVPSSGIAKGTISSLEDAVSSISSCLEQVERQIGLPLTEVYVGLGGPYTSVQPSKGVVGVSTGGEIREDDVRRALESARSVVNPANYEILHVLPRAFTVDGHGGIKDPSGMHGIRLEADVHIIQGLSVHVRNVTKAVMRTNVDVSALVFAPLAAAEVITNARQREVGVAVVNMGATTTSLVVYEEGELLHAAVIPIGSDHITRDIAIVLRTSLDLAERFKQSSVSAYADQVNKFEELDLRELGAEQSETVSPRFVSDVAQARVEEIFEKLQDELKRIGRSGLLPAGAMLTGGGVKMQGMADIGKQVLRLPVAIAAASMIPSPLVEAVHDPAFSTAIGLVYWGYVDERDERGGAQAGGLQRGGEVFKKISSPLKKIFKSFIP